MSNKREMSFNFTHAVNGAIAGAAAGVVLSGAIPHDRNSAVPALCAIFVGAVNGFLAGRISPSGADVPPAPKQP